MNVAMVTVSSYVPMYLAPIRAHAIQVLPLMKMEDHAKVLYMGNHYCNLIHVHNFRMRDSWLVDLLTCLKLHMYLTT